MAPEAKRKACFDSNLTRREPKTVLKVYQVRSETRTYTHLGGSGFPTWALANLEDVCSTKLEADPTGRFSFAKAMARIGCDSARHPAAWGAHFNEDLTCKCHGSKFCLG